jgi:hypothetical protein
MFNHANSRDSNNKQQQSCLSPSSWIMATAVQDGYESKAQRAQYSLIAPLAKPGILAKRALCTDASNSN